MIQLLDFSVAMVDLMMIIMLLSVIVYSFKLLSNIGIIKKLIGIIGVLI